MSSPVASDQPDHSTDNGAIASHNTGEDSMNETATSASLAKDVTRVSLQDNDTSQALTPSASKSKSSRRKSVASAGPKRRTTKKSSKGKTAHRDVQPGQHFFVKLKGYPKWPVIVASEDMLPHELLKTRPVSAAYSDGTWRADYADGSKRVSERSFPVMYLQTNEFGWVSNQDLMELDPTTIKSEIDDKPRRQQLHDAYALAANQHSLNFYKNVLQRFDEEQAEEQAEEQPVEPAEEQAEGKPVSATKAKKPSKSAKRPSNPDVKMDIDAENKPRKRKADDDSPLERSDKAKKPKIKLTSASKPTTKAKNAPESSNLKVDMPKSSNDKPANGHSAVTDEPMTPEQERAHRAKSMLLLRYTLQRGFFTKGQPPKEEDMPEMSEQLTKVEEMPEVEAQVIQKSKVNKVLKAIAKLDTIPRDDEFCFRQRSLALLAKWAKLSTPGSADAAEASTPKSVDAAASHAGLGSAQHESEIASPQGSVSAEKTSKELDASEELAAAPPKDDEEGSDI